MLKKQTITTEEYNSTGDLTRRIVEENEYSEDTPLQMPYQVPCTPEDMMPAKPWWQDAYCTCTEADEQHSASVTVTCSSKENDAE